MTLTRRDLLKLGLAGSGLSWLNARCGHTAGNPDGPPPGSGPVFRLSDGRSLYDDFDGHGGLQSFDGKDLAEAGKLSRDLWVAKPGEDEIVVDPYPEQGPASFVLQMTNSIQDKVLGDFVFLTLDRPSIVEFAACRTFSADILLSSASNVEAMRAMLDYHTTIPEQFQGRSWLTDIGIRRKPGGTVSLFAGAYNINTDYRFEVDLVPASLDRWYNLRLDVVTSRDDASVPAHLFRLDYYVDGVRMASEIPIDAEILIDPERTGGGPNRSLIVRKEALGGTVIAYFDNIRAVYQDRIS